MKSRIPAIALAILSLIGTLHAQVPRLVQYQGRVAVGGTNFSGTGKFKFALVSNANANANWRNDGVLGLGTEPVASVLLPVANGLFSVLLGDTSVPDMAAIPALTFSVPDLHLRVWFSDGANPFELLTPDQRLAPTAYLADDSVNSANIASAAITSAKIASNAITSAKIASGAITGVQVLDGAITGPKVFDGAITSAKIAASAITSAKIASGSLNNTHFSTAAAPVTGQVLGYNGSGLSWTWPGVFLLNGSTAYYDGGNVAIGGIVPTSRLEVFGDITASGAAARLRLKDSAFGGKLSAVGNVNGGIFFRTTNAADQELTTFEVDGEGEATFGGSRPLFDHSRVVIRGGAAWTTAAWGGAVMLDHAAAIGWRPNASGQARGIGHSNGGLYIFRTTSQVSSTTSGATYDVTIRDNGDVGIGTTSPAAKLDVVGNTRTHSITITGGADIAEPFQMKERELEKGSVVVIDDEHPGRLMRSTCAYDTRVAGIVSGANGINAGIALYQEGAIEGGQNVALSGRVYVQADATDASIKPGDLLTTSALPGHAMKVTDHAKAQGAVLGKAMSSLNEETGLVLVLVTLQ